MITPDVINFLDQTGNFMLLDVFSDSLSTLGADCSVMIKGASFISGVVCVYCSRTMHSVLIDGGVLV